MEFFGKGPFENYVDRQSSALVGRYAQRVEDQYHYGYVRPQESGSKTGMKWLRVTDANGTGLGCVNSWGAWPRKEYRVEPAEKYSLRLLSLYQLKLNQASSFPNRLRYPLRR